LFHPRKQRWQDHFTWDEHFEPIIGFTATGRATVEALQLNRPELVNLRRLLYAAGEHPMPETDENLVQPGESSSPVPHGVAPLHTRKTPPPNWRDNCVTQY
jgi:hypothetical protein